MERKIFNVSVIDGIAVYLVYTFTEEQAKQIVVEERGFDYEELCCNEFYLPEDESVSIESLGF